MSEVGTPRPVPILVALVLATTALNLYLSGTTVPLSLVGVNDQHVQILNDSTRFTYAYPWVRPTARAALVLALALIGTLGAVGVAQPRLARRPDAAPWRRVATSLLIAIGGLVATEVVIQAYIRLQPQEYYGGAMLWRMKPNLKASAMPRPLWDRSGPESDIEEDVSNSRGLREREIANEKAPGELRIVCVGHSWTWGAFVSARHRWTDQLQALLARQLPNRRVVVVNAGMPGYTYLQAWMMLSRVALDYQPDLVIVGWLHDVEGIAPQMDDDDDVAPVRRVLEQSAVFTVLRGVLGSAMAGTQPRNLYRERIVSLLGRRGIPTLVMPSTGATRNPPLPGAVSPSEWSARAPVCAWDQNPAQALFKQPRLMTGVSAGMRTHPNADGHARIAHDLADFLMAHRWALSEPSPNR